MRVLFAAPDRDLLRSYGQLLSMALGETALAFDATQLPGLLAQGPFSLAVLDRGLPRLGHGRVLELLRREGVPTLVLQGQALTAGQLLQRPLAEAYLRYPFEPEELLTRAGHLLELRACERRLPLGRAALRVADFALPDGTPLTLEELELLERLLEGPCLPSGREGVYAAALNEKLAKICGGVRIAYRAGEGFQLVTDDETG